MSRKRRARDEHPDDAGSRSANPPSRCDDRFEKEAAARGETPVAGADEVGRGALFGPVVAGAVILGSAFDWAGLNDSKQLTARRREELDLRIREGAQAWAIGVASAEEIDRLNIRMATHLAIRRAVAGLKVAPRLVLVDGIDEPLDGVAQKAIVKGDALSVSIAAASIIAKVRRDSMIEEWDATCPGFGLKENKGYGSAAHLDALRTLGPSPFHRKSFIERTGWLF
ncbi:MAG: ribonuclease HII [Vicinamibacteria bacterium]|nr:ribonuclease HII [Vicinamibacteria bacterium]